PEQSTPVITAAGDEAEGDNTFYFNATISITADAGASIYYTTDGNEPTEASTLYTDPFQITTTNTIKAIAVKPYYQNSNVSTLEVTITAPTVEAPVFTPGTGTYADSVVFSIACATDNSEIRYTMDGTEPTETSTLYSAPISLTNTTTVKAKAFKTDWFTSETATAVYTVVYDPVLTVNTPALNFTSTQLSQEFTVSGAHLDEAITLTCNNTHFTVNPATITNPNNNTVVTVTFDGSEPATGIIAIVSDTLSAQVSLTATAQLPAPEFTADITDTMVTVTISCTVADAAIHYTIDGTEPTAESDTYTEPIVFSTPGSYTVKSMATKATWENSTVAISDTYIINEPPTPQPLDTIIYSVGFEASEGFVVSDVYNNTDIAYTGANGHQWGTYYGTPSTTSPIQGSQSMQMRWYSSTANSLGYTFTNFDLRNVTHVTFLAKNSNGLKVKVSHSVDGGNTYSDGEIFTLGSTAQGFDYVVDEDGSYDFVRLKFSIVLPETAPTSTSRLYLDSVVVYGIPGIAPSMASIPSINPNSGFFYEPQTVSITCETEDAVIRYTTDGSEPTEASTIYTEPFQVSATTTIKAKAWKTDLAPSFTATAEISFPAQVLDIAAFKDAASNEPQQIMSDVTFVFRSGRYIFVEDNSAAMLIFDNSPATITSTYNEGDVIHSGVFGRYSLYHGMVEMVPSHNAAAATGTPVTVTPTVATVANVKSQYNDIYESKLVRLNDVEFINDTLFVQNGDTMSIRDRFNTVDLEISAGDHADVIGFVCYSYSHGYQIYPRNNQDIIISAMETVATPEFFFQRDGEFYRMTITCETEGASIYYTIDGNDPDESSYEYTDAVPFYLNVHYIINAIAMKEGMNNSAIATYDYNPVGISQ
ncbi:MAG: chitobiase/beta-hexosaminidase C-terminal domain-containing protein, partial [Bacteroidales bacterium]|nr:chitobiase/beta-hexosaminidase C-terminal domain-containing protein [Bacteroidales bacterium]